MLTKTEVAEFAEDWIAAWNSHDLEKIMTHYENDVELISPAAAQILKDPKGRVVGKHALREYFRKGLETYPHLEFTLKDILWGVNSIILYYINQKGTCTGEYMEISPSGKVSRVVANYSA
jgi:ketosteroid isomerase-like protein